MTLRPELQDKEIGELWRRYRPLEGHGVTADLIMTLLRKLVIQAHGTFLMVIGKNGYRTPLRLYGISQTEWDS